MWKIHTNTTQSLSFSQIDRLIKKKSRKSCLKFSPGRKTLKGQLNTTAAKHLLKHFITEALETLIYYYYYIVLSTGANFNIVWWAKISGSGLCSSTVSAGTENPSAQSPPPPQLHRFIIYYQKFIMFVWVSEFLMYILYILYFLFLCSALYCHLQ